MDDLVRDFRVAVRSLRATPIVAGVAILSLALAIGANTAMFSILNGLLLRRLPVREPERLVLVTDRPATPSASRVRVWDYPFWEQISQRTELFDATAAWSLTRFNLAPGGETQFVNLVWASGSFFDTLGVEAMLGRTFSERDDQRGGGPDGPVAVISYGYWRRQFGGGADVVGRSIRLNTVQLTIVGVTPPEFFGAEVGRTFDLIVPLRTEPAVAGRDSALDSPGTNFLTVLGRLDAGQSVETATAALQGMQPRIRAVLTPSSSLLSKQFLDRYLKDPFTLVPAATGFSNLRRDYERPLLVIAGVVGLVLLLACVNVANLLLARAISRRHEMSVRRAVGASRWRLARQLLTESLLLSATGAALGILIASSSADLLVRQLSTTTTTVFLDVSIDRAVLAFTIAVTMVTAVIFGTAPAFWAARVDPMGALKDQGRAATEQTRSGLTNWLVVVQVALSVVLVVAAGLFIRSFTALTSRPLGFEPEHVLIVRMDPQRSNVEPDQRVPLYERARDAVLALPDVTAAAVSHLTPVGGGGFTPQVEVSGVSVSIPQSEVFGNLISPGFFRTFGTPLVAGRDVEGGDRKGAPRVAVINEAFSRRFFGSGNPLGRTITVFPNSPRARSMEIVGVAANAVYTSPHDAAPPTWYAPIGQFDVPGFPFASARLSVRARTGSPMLLTKSVAPALAAVDPRLSLTFQPLANQVRASLTQNRLMAQLGGFFGALALLLAAIGLYGVTAYGVSRRRTEIAIRMALGAAPTGVIGLVLTRLSPLIGLGGAVGAGTSLWSAKFVGGLIHGLPPRDPATLAGAVLVLAIVGTLAGWLPARRAARIDPVAVLRES